MGSRTMPTDCEHGVTIDYGDFGPCQDCDTDHDPMLPDVCPNFQRCAECDAAWKQTVHDNAIAYVRSLPVEQRMEAMGMRRMRWGQPESNTDAWIEAG